MLTFVLLATLTSGSATASAGDYTVSMGEIFGCQNHSWDHGASTSLYQSYDLFCGGNYVDDIAAAINQADGRSNGFDNAGSTFHAPAGTWISHADISWSDSADRTHNFGVGLHYLDSGGSWHNFDECLPSESCIFDQGSTPTTWPGNNYDFPAGTSAIGSFAVCAASWCDHTPQHGEWAQAYVEIHSAQVTVHEDTTPTITYTGGGLPSGSWLRGAQGVSFNASDPSGIKRVQLWVDGNRSAVMADPGELGCDFTYATPCSNISAGNLSFDTSRLSNGAHTFQVGAADAAGNWTDARPTTFYVNNSPPGEIQAPSVEGGQGWHTTNSFTVHWTNPPNAAPITTAYYEVCDQSGQNCRQGSQGAQGINELTGVQVSAPGVYKLRVWVGDAAGNASGAKSPFMTLEYDATVPGAAIPMQKAGWVNAAQAGGYREEIDPPSPVPPSGIAGYAVTVDGSDPGTTMNVPADPISGSGSYRFDELPEGVTTVRARAISGAGVVSTSVGSAVIRVDKTAPTVTVSGNPDPSQWTTAPVSVALAATDALSGMAPADNGDPDPADGAYLDYSVDNGSDHKVRGASASVPVATDGSHVITYQAFDLAGNGSAQRSVYFKIDRTPPVAAFEAQDAADPSKVSVVAADATSGLADGGLIEMRTGDSDWVKLATTHEGGHYYTHLSPATMAPGRYTFQAAIPDQAGNTVTTTSRAADGAPGSGGTEEITIDGCRVNGILDPACVAATGSGGGQGSAGAGQVANGSYTVIDNLAQFEIAPDGRPYDYGATVGTFLRAGVVTKRTVRRGTRLQCQRGRRCKRVPRTVTVDQFVSNVRLAYGQGASLRGDVTLADHAPLGDVQVLVLERDAAAGMRYRLVRTVTTDRSGTFAYNAPPGPSRTVTFLYRGSSVYRHSTGSADLSVPAAATISASRHAVGNGQSVTFSGNLLGRPYPHPGKLIALQAFYRGKWRTFATTRANDTGGWRYSYRFGATHGIVVYRFRAQISREAAYPYLLGYSSTVAVRVTG